VPSRNRLASGNPTSRVVVGLGNAERQYSRTRHNIGAQAVREAITRLSLREARGLIPIPMSRSGLVLPEGFMNDSGTTVFKAVERWRPTAEHLLVVHDELDLPLGQINEKQGGGHGGHNGLRDIIACLGSSDFQRLRIGIGRQPPGEDVADYVLTTFRPEERQSMERAIDEAATLIVAFVRPDG
jgi:peptidyl-tRNA hydrolase, PTH1 family